MYTIKDRFFSGCFVKGIDKNFKFSLGNSSEKKFHLSIFDNGSKVGEWTVISGYTSIEIPTKNSIANLKFALKEPITPESNLYLFQVKTTEYKLYYKAMVFSLIVSLLILILNYDNIRQKSRLLFVSFFLICYSLFYISFTNLSVPFIGDEPHYMVLGESLIEDLDLELNNQSRTDKPSLLFGDFRDHSISKNGIEYSIHYPFLALFISPAFANQQGIIKPVPVLTAKVLITIAFSGFFALMLTIVLSEIRSKFESVIIVSTVFGMPYIAYSSQIFPEVLISILLFVSFYSLYENKFGRFKTYIPAVLVIFPFLHIKFLAVSVIIILYWIYTFRKEKTKLVTGTIVYGLGLIGFIFYNRYTFGSISPYQSRDFFLSDLIRRYTGYLFDTDRGIFALNPLLLFSLIEITRLFKKNFLRSIFPLALIFAGHLPNLFHTVFWLGSCPVGRYWIAVYPLIAYFSFLGIRQTFDYIEEKRSKQWEKYGWNFLIGLIAGLSLLQTWTFINVPDNYYTHFDHRFIMCKFIFSKTGIDLKFLYYSFFVNGTEIRSLIWYLLLLVFITIGFRIEKFHRSDRKLDF
ncbi:hypothetical protein [Leptospira dzoumogneensis]|uniref:Glycosyltransferase RgtA/B/C/D-like domain-containing protein n=1 Tax=Leptospira dzoumogneensis TaxID=2484904 RepID=A0A4Z1ANC1_9LEPT|nr:hypothetical protein [Leptospira dzoumogneensis]TGN03122.1 hypothetical protein EHR06_03695 [Leptospira dzoumogneensis]